MLTKRCLLISSKDVVALIAHSLGIVILICVGAISHFTFFAVSCSDDSAFSFTVHHNFCIRLHRSLLDTLFREFLWLIDGFVVLLIDLILFNSLSQIHSSLFNYIFNHWLDFISFLNSRWGGTILKRVMQTILFSLSNIFRSLAKEFSREIGRDIRLNGWSGRSEEIKSS